MSDDPNPTYAARERVLNRVCRFCGITNGEALDTVMGMICKATGTGFVHDFQAATGEPSPVEPEAASREAESEAFFKCRCIDPAERNGVDGQWHRTPIDCIYPRPGICGVLMDPGVSYVWCRLPEGHLGPHSELPATGEPSFDLPEDAEARRDQSVDLEAELSRAETLVIAASELPQFDGVPLLQRAQVLAEISQAKELKRIADILERWVHYDNET